MWSCTLSSEIPFSLFSSDGVQHSVGDLNSEKKTFLWHQFMLDVLLNIPRSPTAAQDAIHGCKLLNDLNNQIWLQDNDAEKFAKMYESTKAINTYTHASFLFDALNKASRTLNSGALVLFHSIVKDINAHLKQLQTEQMQTENGLLVLPLTVYRAQTTWGAGDLEKLVMNEGGLISMNTFLSTTRDSQVVCQYLDGTDKDTAVMFTITVNDTDNNRKFQTFADISEFSQMKDEKEVLFGMSSIFKMISAEHYGPFWDIQLELTSCECDANVQRLTGEVKNYLHQVTNKQMPFVTFKQLLTRTSLGSAEPLLELFKYVVADATQLFVRAAFTKQGRMKAFIEQEPSLRALVQQTTDADIVGPDETSICRLFDMLSNLLYREDDPEKKAISFDDKDVLSLICFGGFLLLTGDCEKAVQYLKMLLEYNWIDARLQGHIHVTLGACYVMLDQKKLASNSFDAAMQAFETSMGPFMPSWFAAFAASSRITLHGTEQPAHHTMQSLEASMDEEQSDNDINEKLRLFYKGHTCSEQQKFTEALNHWEEAVEIVSYIPSTMTSVFNGAIYVQMAAAYFRLNNSSDALTVMERGLETMKLYYPPSHRMFATLGLLYGYFLLLNEQSAKAIDCLENSRRNPHFSNDREYLAVVYSLLGLSYIHSSNLDKGEEMLREALLYRSPINIAASIAPLLEELPEWKIIAKFQDPDYPRRSVLTGFQIGQRLLALFNPKTNTPTALTDEQSRTCEEMIVLADYHRHRNDYVKAEKYYRTALEKTTESDGKQVWQIYRKMIRMKRYDVDRYRDYFIEQYSRYDDENPHHFQIIATLKVIMYRLCLTQHESQLAFDCLTHSVLMQIKSLSYQISVGSNSVLDLFARLAHQDEMANFVSILTKAMEIDTSVGRFLSKYFVGDNLASIIHHAQLDNILEELRSNFEEDPPATSMIRFLQTLLRFLRQCIAASETSTSPLKDQVLKFLSTYTGPNASLFHLMNDDSRSFLVHLDQLQRCTFTCERYEQLKRNTSRCFDSWEEDCLYTYLQHLAENV